MSEAVHAVVTGLVQGVFFRAETVNRSKSLGLTGWVRNLDGSAVELVAVGEASQLEALLQWLWQGPPAAQVEDVKWESIPEETFSDFRIRRD